MTDGECVSFLQWALPLLRLRWPGFRKVRGQVCKRIQRRMKELGLEGADAYRRFLATHPEEWLALEQMCRVTISCFYRDRAVFDGLSREVLPALAGAAIEGGRSTLTGWSAGCGSGEEPYTLTLIWGFLLRSRFPSLSLRLVATDVDRELLGRAERACYPPSSLAQLPPEWREAAFEVVEGEYALHRRFQQAVEFGLRDIRGSPPEGPFDLILCRNLVFTYFEESLQRQILTQLLGVLAPGGALIVGRREIVPSQALAIAAWPAIPCTYRKSSAQGDSS